MSDQTKKNLYESSVAERFLDDPNDDTFTEVFNLYRPQIVAFFRARNCELALAEDLAQEVMLTVHRKAEQIRDRTLFRGWLFKVARRALCRHYSKRMREVGTVDLNKFGDRLTAASQKPATTPAFEFMHWMAFLDSRERDALTLRFVEDWEYHEIAAARDIPIGTVQWRVFNAKKKLVPHLAAPQDVMRKAA
jgi:RNA polymerase sigma-70 factor (ECF subfamily)